MNNKKVNSPKDLNNQTEIKDILIVDDTPANLHLLSNMLSERGYQVRPVPDGQLALAAVKAQLPDLILLDIRMPGMNGYQVCENLRNDPQTRAIPVIFLSALDAVEDKLEAFSKGGVDYITKPFRIEEVLARVETHLTLSDLRQKLQRANENMTRELIFAGQVQRSFLPDQMPEVNGWQVAVKLEPARETSGDFFDIHHLPDDKTVILAADVLDKGVGAALFMALCWIIFHTYASRYPSRPELVLKSVNRRILQDTKANQFVTVFYSILDTTKGELLFSNAGHPLPLIFRGRNKIERIGNKLTGLPLGLFPDSSWNQSAVQLNHGDVLIIYTDGISEANNSLGEFFDEKGLVESVKKYLGKSAQQIADGVLSDVKNFIGDNPQSDDIALIVVVRE